MHSYRASYVRALTGTDSRVVTGTYHIVATLYFLTLKLLGSLLFRSSRLTTKLTEDGTS